MIALEDLENTIVLKDEKAASTARSLAEKIAKRLKKGRDFTRSKKTLKVSESLFTTKHHETIAYLARVLLGVLVIDAYVFFLAELLFFFMTGAFAPSNVEILTAVLAIDIIVVINAAVNRDEFSLVDLYIGSNISIALAADCAGFNNFVKRRFCKRIERGYFITSLQKVFAHRLTHDTKAYKSYFHNKSSFFLLCRNHVVKYLLLYHIRAHCAL
jgi:hypothetical protein